MLAFDQLLGVPALHVLPRQLEQYFVAFGLCEIRPLLVVEDRGTFATWCHSPVVPSVHTGGDWTIPRYTPNITSSSNIVALSKAWPPKTRRASGSGLS
jgi:hypothetical protein